MKLPTFRRGFTLVELLVTIAIIALLTGIIMTNLVSSRAKARDAKRISDLGQIQLSLELFFDRCRGYPTSIANPTTSDTNPRCGALYPPVTLNNFISQIPVPPLASDGASYGYAVNDPSNPTDYALHTTLEITSPIIKDGLSDLPPTIQNSPFPCSNDPAQKQYCLGAK